MPALIWLFCSASVANADSETYVNVGLKYGSNSVVNSTVKSSEGFVYGRATDSGFEEEASFPVYSELSVSLVSGNITVMAPDGTTFDFSDGYCLMPADYANGGLIYVDAVPYRGGIVFRQNSSGGLNIINHVGLDDYVRGVLGAELGASSPLESLKAQAVAARSYVVCNRNKHRDQGFDVCCTTHCQVYSGYRAETERTNQATEETLGEVLYYDGEPVVGFYSKNCGGYTQDVEDVWGNSLGYLRSVKDEYSPEYSWEKSYTLSELERMLENSGKSVGTLLSVSIDERLENGYVSKLTFNGTSGSTSFTGEKIKSFFGASIVKSNLFSFSYITQESIGVSANQSNGSSSGNTGSVQKSSAASGSTGKISKLYTSNGSSVKAAESSLYVIGKDGNKTKVKTENIVASNGTSKVSIGEGSDDTGSGGSTEKPAAGPLTKETSYGSTVTFYGLGYGHGVGMPQDSAINMGKLGFDYKTILKYYYTDVQIKQYR